jgi:serine/threonine-protein kinase
LSEVPGKLAKALADRYAIERKLGEGGMATVYLAEDLKHERRVAIKVLKPELAAVIGGDRFVTEIKTTASLQHPHILPLFDSGEADGFLFYVMPFVDGESLREKLDREKQLAVDEAAGIARAIASALNYAHEQGVVHRDIKPANILIHAGEPMVADFGIALAISAAGGGRLTETGMSVGTPHYMSPEQASADRDVDARSDIYSLSCMLYEMLAGQPPHTGPSAQAILMRILTEEPRDISDARKAVPPNIRDAIRKGLEKLPADRFETGDAFAKALADPGFRHGQEGGSPVGVAGSVHSGPWRALALSLGAAAALLTVGLLFTLTRTSTPPRVVRAPVEFPEDHSGFVISADGSTMATRVDDAVYVRSLDDLQWRALPGTDSMRSFTLSPDGSSLVGLRSSIGVAFEIRVISLSGGTPRVVLVDSTRAIWAISHWGRDGVLYGNATARRSGFATTRIVGLSLDAVMTLPVALDTTTEESHSAPYLSEDGDLFFVSRVGTDGSSRSINVLERGESESRPLLPGLGVCYAGRGIVIYRSDTGALTAARFRRGDPTFAAPVELAPDARRCSVSEDGTLLYLEGETRTGTPPNTAVQWADAAGNLRVVDPSWGPFDFLSAPLAPLLSPSADRVAFVDGLGNQDGADIWIKTLDEGSRSRLTTSGNTHPIAWSADGDSILYLHSEGEDSPTSLLMRLANGADQPVEILREDGFGNASVVAASDWLVHEVQSDATGRDIRAIGPVGPVDLLNSGADERDPSLSPDGRWLAYTSDESGEARIYIRSFPAIDRERVMVSNVRSDVPRWSPDGDELVYRAFPGDGMELRRVPVSTGASIELGEESAIRIARGTSIFGIRTFDVAPDGRIFTLTHGDLEADEPDEQDRVIMIQNVFTEIERRLGN